VKKSEYNIFVLKKNCVLGYNTISFSHLAISHNIYEKFLQNNVEDFEKEYPKCYENFVDSGFIIDDSKDELNEIRFENRKRTFVNREYFITVYPTQDCNLKCWYCYENHVKDSVMSQDVLESIVNHIKQKAESKSVDFIHLTFFGGEPLLYFDTTVLPLLEKAKTICDNASIPFLPFFITNGSLIDEPMIMKLKEFNPMFQITIDGNRKKHDTVRIGKINNYPTFDKIINAYHLITQHITCTHHFVSRILTIRINYDNQTLKNIDEIIDNIKDIKKDKVFIHLERVWQTLDRVDDYQRQLLKEAIIKLSSHGFNVGQGVFGKRSSYSCPAEVYDYAVINYNGLVYRCNGRNLTPETAEGCLLPNGTIEWNKQALIKRLARTTYENDRCINCKMLPQCMGPCSQKQMENGWGNIDNICSKNVLDVSLNDYLTLDFEVEHILKQIKEQQTANE
jgi:uncharacterized protein